MCPDFAPYHALKNDLYKGSLFGGTNLYYKTGENGTRGMVTTKRNVAKYKLDQFPRNFKTSNAINRQPETGWSGTVPFGPIDLFEKLYRIIINAHIDRIDVGIVVIPLLPAYSR